jgi:hypothetical protein
MSDEGKPLRPEQQFKKVIWRSMLGVSSSLQQSTTWTITGLAAVAGLLINKLDSIAHVVSSSGLRWGLILLSVSLLFGVVSKLVGMAIANGLDTVTKVETLLYSPDGKQVIAAMAAHPKQLIEDLAAPFWWPMSRYIRKAGLMGLTDYLSTEKRLIRMFCFQICANVLHAICAAGAIITIACAIKE